MPQEVQIGMILSRNGRSLWAEERALLGASRQHFNGPFNGPRSEQTRYSFSVTKHRAGCGSVRGSPVLSSHFSRGLAPQVGQRTAKACFFSAFMTG